MRLRPVAPGIIGLCLVCSSGCHLVTNATRNAWFETTQCVEDHRERCRNKKLAKEAWESTQAAHPDEAYSEDYAEGFKEGFADYLEAGGNGRPPLLPPQRYWKTCYQTPQGYHAIEEWFAGFGHGAAAALESGYRQWITVPAGLPGPAPGNPHPGAAPVPPVPNAAAPAAPEASGSEVLPQPRRSAPKANSPQPPAAPAAPLPKDAPEPAPEASTSEQESTFAGPETVPVREVSPPDIPLNPQP